MMEGKIYKRQGYIFEVVGQNVLTDREKDDFNHYANMAALALAEKGYQTLHIKIQDLNELKNYIKRIE